MLEFFELSLDALFEFITNIFMFPAFQAFFLTGLLVAFFVSFFCSFCLFCSRGDKK